MTVLREDAGQVRDGGGRKTAKSGRGRVRLSTCCCVWTDARSGWMGQASSGRVKAGVSSALKNPGRLMQKGSEAETVLLDLQDAGILMRESCKS